MQIYLDHSATTPPRPKVIATAQNILTQQWGNPSSLHHWGERAATVLEMARFQVAHLINAPTADSIIFTSGGTEADNLAIMGIARRYSSPQHLIISSVEHSAISEPAKILESWGWEVTRLGVDSTGRINPRDLEVAIRPNTVLVSIIYAQSEVGTIQPIAELAEIAHQRGILFHTDAVQAAGKIPLDVQKISIDLLSLSSHKIYGIQGAGALYVRPGVELVPLLAGGGQELKLRSGTQAVPIIAAFGTAAELAAQELQSEAERLRKLRDRLFSLLSPNPRLIPTGNFDDRLPHHLSFCLKGSTEKPEITGKTLVRQMNQAGIAISSGSACNSGKLNPSPVLTAMGYPENLALGAIRLTLGKDTSEADIDWVAMVLNQVLERLFAEEKTLSNV